MFDTPQGNRANADNRNKPLLSLELLFRCADWANLEHFTVRRDAGTVRGKKQQPDENDRDERDRDGNSKPLEPVKWDLHCLERDEVLRRRDGRTLTANVGRERDPELQLRMSGIPGYVDGQSDARTMMAGPNDERAGIVRRMGRISVKHNVGAATLLIHMLAKHATPMNASNTMLGLVPARLSSRVMSRRSMLVLLSADAMVNPPMRSMIVGENITENTYLHAKR